jgi:hypothetical protein
MSDVDFSPWNGTMSSTGLKPKLQPTRTQSKFHVSTFKKIISTINQSNSFVGTKLEKVYTRLWCCV